jgi:lysophospholipase L1-like esterase
MTFRLGRTRNVSIAVACAGVAICCVPLSAFRDKVKKPGGEHWVATWSTANSDLLNPYATAPFGASPPPVALDNGTIREIVHTSVGGREIRIRISNVFGDAAIKFDAIYVGLAAGDAAILSGTNRAVAFGGSKSVTLPEGSDALSDPIALDVESQVNLAISLFTSSNVPLGTGHAAAFQTNFISTPGNFAADETAAAFTKTVGSWYFLAEVDALVSPNVRGAIVALGDSITDGASTKSGANARWTSVLARRLLAHTRDGAMSVLNSGIGGNRVLTSSPCFGVNALARLDRDVFDHVGVRDVILLEGTNDIGQPDTPASAIRPAFMPCLSQTQITADDLIAGYKQIIAQARAMNLKVFGATILPFKGFGGWTDHGEATRQAANKWIRESGAFDGVIDFDAALRDPANPASLNPVYDSGDHLHPNTAGHEAMANAIDLSLFR